MIALMYISVILRLSPDKPPPELSKVSQWVQHISFKWYFIFIFVKNYAFQIDVTICDPVHDVETTLIQSYKRTPNIFYASSKSKKSVNVFLAHLKAHKVSL